MYEKLARRTQSHWTYVSDKEQLIAVVSALSPRYLFFLHWNWLVPEAIWKKNECVCFHMTDVPYGRGGSPLQNLILAGHEETKLTALKMSSEMDAGPVYIKRPLRLDGTAQEIYIRAGELSAEIIEWMIKQEPKPVEQAGDAILFKRRRPEQSRLPETGSLRSAYDFIRMLDADGYPHAFLEYGEFMLKLSKASLVNGRLVAQVEVNKKSSE